MEPIIENAKIVAKENCTSKIFSIWLETEKIAHFIQPGQFINVRVSKGFDPFLRRPFSVANVKNNLINFFFRIVGKGTKIIAESKVNDSLEILGPLGRAIELPQNKKIALFGGGIGIPPLFFLAQRLILRKNTLKIILGAKNKTELVMSEEFNSLPAEIFFCTEDGSFGEKGKVVEIALKKLTSSGWELGFACGPMAMYQELAKFFPSSILGFLEERMGCGCGLCFACAFPKKGGGYIHLCQEGPVTLLEELAL